MVTHAKHKSQQTFLLWPGMRILVNLAAPAGFACGAEEGEVGRYGALVALNAIDPEEPVTII